MTETFFVELPVNDCEAAPLNGVVMITFVSPEEAIDKLIKDGMKCGSKDYMHTYTAGCYGDENQVWDYSHYEIYEPKDSILPSMVVLRYLPRNPHAAKLFYGN